jgi:hypothetical protein
MAQSFETTSAGALAIEQWRVQYWRAMYEILAARGDPMGTAEEDAARARVRDEAKAKLDELGAAPLGRAAGNCRRRRR